MDDIQKRINTILIEQLSIQADQITDTVTFDELGADSLDRVEIIMKIEEALDLELNDDDVEKITTVSELITYVATLKQKN